MNLKSTAVVLVAGGSGLRMGTDIPKQFIKIEGREIIEHTLSVFLQSEVADKIVIVCKKAYIAHVNQLVSKLSSPIPIIIAEGGFTRQSSVYNGLLKAADCEYVMIHDAVRCCITVEDIRKLKDNLSYCDSCALGVKVKDTIKLADGTSDNILKTINRKNLWHIQTPQAFKTADIISAHELAINNGFEATDDCAIAEKAGMTVNIVEGSYSNIKVTTPVDLILAREILKGGLL